MEREMENEALKYDWVSSDMSFVDDNPVSASLMLTGIEVYNTYQ